MNNLGPVRRKLKNKPVTIIIGIKFKDGILIGSDGQTSYEASTAKEMDTDKISVVKFADGLALVAQSGAADPSVRAVEIMTEKAAGLKIESARTVANVAEAAMDEVREHLREYNRHTCSTPEDFQRLFREYDFSLMLASYFNKIPQLYIASLEHGMAIKQGKNYATAGCGGSIAQMFLCDLPVSEMDLTNAAISVAYIIEKVKRHDWACGGETNMGFIFPDGNASKSSIRSRKHMEKLSKACQDFEAEEREIWRKNSLDIVKRIATKWKPDND